ncbi:MAG: TIGR01777 family oxidoreductase [Bacteroidales bacterium]|nr:TIGR01777 family oxidoreductase [Bacteroidales bacterium]
MTKNILITGGSGLVGKHLSDLLIQKGYNVGILSRNPTKSDKIKYFHWDYTKNEIDSEAIDFANVIIHLAGANISHKKWTNSQKKIIIDSRVKTTELILSELKKSNKKLDAFISASAIGFYGTKTTEKIFVEEDKSGTDFLSEVVVKWENSVDLVTNFTQRIVKLRIGVVLSKDGGALLKMTNIIKKGIGSPLGSGKQYMPWISIEDLAHLFLYAAENQNITEAYNAVSPIHITNSEFMKGLAKQMNKPFFMPKVPAFAMKAILGEMASLLLEGSRVSSKKIQDAGFTFKYDLETVLKTL